MVTLEDAAGNESEASSATVPDTLAPLAPTDITVTPDGGTINGKGEPDTKVVIRDSDDNIVGEGTVGPDGNFQVGLVPPQRDGGQLSVTLEDAAENVSEPGSATAPIIDPDSTIPVDDNVTAGVVVQPTETPVSYPGASYLALIGLLGLDLRVLSVNSVDFTVAQGHQQNLQLSYSQAVGLDLAGGTSIIIQKLMPDGTWSSVDGSGDATLLSLTLLGNRAEASALLGEGTYRAFAAVQNTVSVGLLGNLQVSGTDLNYQEPAGVQVSAIQGNILTNDGGSVDADHIVTNVSVGGTPHAVVAGAQGTTIDGLYGTLIIHQDGSYTYTPNATLANIGKVDQFTYTKYDPLTQTSTTAELNIRINSDGQGLVWNDDNFGEDATYDFAATDDVNGAGIAWTNVVNNNFHNYTQTVSALLGGGQGDSTPFTIGSNMDAFGTITVSVNLAAAATGTVGLQRLVGGSWQNVGTPESFQMTVGLLGTIKTIDIGSLDLPAGQYRVHTTLSGLAGSVNTVTDVKVIYTDLHVIQNNPGVEGNLFENDGNLPLSAKLQVEGTSGFVTISAAGTIIEGVYGDLTIYSNGEYKYQPHSNLAYADREESDTFTYKIVLPNGHESTAELTINLEEGLMISRMSLSEDVVGDATGAEYAASDVIPLGDHSDPNDANTDDQDSSEHNLTEALLLDDGIGEVTLPFGEDETSDEESFVSASITNGSATSADPILSDDPLSHLVPDPLLQEDDLNTTHSV
ncbi:hypothetical protein H5024_04820 [Ochrobactrum sp. Marseille-Q0166]|nr:hypothetical protein [Ochrobactrum sp. Marseille-Q0166]